jgi:hypothetical protein
MSVPNTLACYLGNGPRIWFPVLYRGDLIQVCLDRLSREGLFHRRSMFIRHRQRALSALNLGDSLKPCGVPSPIKGRTEAGG